MLILIVLAPLGLYFLVLLLTVNNNQQIHYNSVRQDMLDKYKPEYFLPNQQEHFQYQLYYIVLS